MGRKYGFSFSWKRAAGISGAKGRMSRRIGIPLTRSGRERKLGRMTSGGRCFVATACYGDAEHPTVVALRYFRDDVLRRSTAGRWFTAWYYRRGPAWAAIVARRPRVAALMRAALGVLVALLGRRAGRSTPHPLV